MCGRAEERAVENAEHRRVHADAQREREDDDRREQRAGAESCDVFLRLTLEVKAELFVELALDRVAAKKTVRMRKRSSLQISLRTVSVVSMVLCGRRGYMFYIPRRVSPTCAVGANVGFRRAGAACSNAYASLRSVASLHALPTNEMPTGSPRTRPIGTVMCG
jgi:hypothetical protein